MYYYHSLTQLLPCRLRGVSVQVTRQMGSLRFTVLSVIHYIRERKMRRETGKKMIKKKKDF